MNSKLGYRAVLVVLTGAALFLRVYHLDNRPFHADESVHAFKLWDLYAHHRYAYDSNEYHGPTHYYVTLPVLALRHPATIGDVSEADCRLAVAVLGALLVPTLTFLVGVIGKRAVLMAACLLALSPAHVFYSRYFIQETLLVLFTLLFFAAWASHARRRSLGSALSAGAACGLMLATKETAALTILAWLVSCAFIREPGARRVALRASSVPLLLGICAALVTSAVILSNGFRNPAAVAGYLHAFTPWLQRAHGTDLHTHAWSYYLEMLVWHRRGGSPVWTEPVLLALALVGVVRAFQPGAGNTVWHRRFVLFTFLTLAVYSAIPYKTPWCILTPLFGVTLCAGVGGAWLLNPQQPPWLRGAASVAVLLGVLHAGRLAWLTSFVYQTNPANPYVYAQTVPDAVEIERRAEAIASVHPDGHRMVVKVIWNDSYYWPIPWYLRRFPHVGYYQSVPADPSAPLVLASPVYDEQLTRRLDATHLMNGYIGLRPQVVVQVWVDFELWKRYIEAKQRSQRKEEMP